MGRPSRWTFVAIALCLSFPDKAICQKKFNMIGENPSSTDLYNSILTTAACNGVLPEIISKMQGQPIVESLSKCPYPQDILTKPLSVVPMPSCINGPESIIFSSQPPRQFASNQNMLLATSGPSVPALQSTSPSSLSSSNWLSQFAQASPLENYSVCAQNFGVAQPKPMMLPQSQCNEINAYYYNQFAEPMLSDIGSCNFPTLPPIQGLPPINMCSGEFELTSNLGFPCLAPLSILTNDCSQAALQITLPPTSMPAPKVTVVSASPSNCPVSLSMPYGPDYTSNSPPYPYPPQPPIVLGNSKSSWKKLLPLLLVALLSDRGCDDGGRRCCCCSCNGGGNSIPIPYPIPIPINNPIVITGSASRNCENNDDVEEDFEYDRKRK